MLRLMIILLFAASSALNPPGWTGYVRNTDRNLVVIGTVHTPSKQQRVEVAELIAATRPDIVVVELDAERLELLLNKQQNQGEMLAYGAELAEAVAAAVANFDEHQGRAIQHDQVDLPPAALVVPGQGAQALPAQQRFGRALPAAALLTRVGHSIRPVNRRAGDPGTGGRG